ncbi:unnamed protein product [Colias eurytheme]|nr:unnamed protein product [Colias eurytheme]
MTISPNGKIYKGPVKQSSPHHNLWKKAKEVLKTVKFIKKVNVADKIHKTETTVPSITNFIKTIEGMEALWKLLSGKYKLDAMLTRNFNQDPLENFFGNIRSYGARNVAPNSVAFEGANKALMLNNYSTPHSKGANCEEDVNECLQTLEFFIREKIEAPESPDVPEEQEINFNKEICLEQPIEADSGQRNYVCGWVLKKCLTNVVKNCQQCRQNLLDNRASNENNTFMKAKEYQNKKWLCYPNEEIEKYFQEIQTIAVTFLKSNMSRKNIKFNIIALVDIFIDLSFKCTIHKDNLKKCFINTTINVLIYSWCRSVNRILNGKIKYNGDDETKLAAQLYFNKYRHYKNKK